MSILSKFWAAPATGVSAEDRAIRVEQILSLARMTPVFVLACGIMSILTVAVLWDFAQPALALPWVAVITILPCLTLPSWWRNRQKTKPEDYRAKSITLITNRTIYLGLIWGLGLALLYPAEALPQQLFLAMVVAGVGIGGAASLAAIPRASIGFSMALLLPFLVRVLLGEGWIFHQNLIAMASIFVIFVLFLSRTAYASFLDMVRARVANEGLVRDLEKMRNNLLDAIDSTSEGFAIFDEDDRLQFFNEKYLAMFGPLKERIVAGIRFSEILDIIPTPILGEDEGLGGDDWRTWRMRRHEEGGSSIQQQHIGHWRLSTDRRTRQGVT